MFDKNYFKGTVPKQIDKTVKKFCQSINYKAAPLYIDVKPYVNSKLNECFCNVTDYLKTNKGEMLIGWAIWLIPHCMIEAECHAVLKNENGTLIDITPHKDNENKILFLEDKSIKYSGFQIDNIRKNISKSKLIDILISNSRELVRLQNKDQLKYQHGKVTLKGEDAEKFKKLLLINQMLIDEFYEHLKLKPNDYCICGSGLRFIDCCKRNLK